ncbi:MAG: hypothetical protein L5656_05095 [Thermanaeromonas sp.]|uniref:hypothetical protein n=1 Tax=Thermanaeromonas sp. TaxID=2003697 RepID=UPI002437E3C5|nr:hypothetical protein [Thermanaeromonas sp.]MCG0277888.1 hypothetical protein [Thermanaeromonas sp.]
MSELKALLAGALASVLAWIINRQFLARWKLNISLWGPLGEELLKTGLAFLLGGSLALTHFTFGLVEGCWEWGRGRRGAAWGAVASHTFFGLCSFFAWRATNSFFWAWGAAAAVHIGWNSFFYFLHRQPPRT